jgi:hypothetical protein
MAFAPAQNLFDEVTDFLARAPGPEAIIEFRPSAALASRGEELLARSRDGLLTPDERAEMDEFLRMEHFMTMLKLKARLVLKGSG